MKQIPYRLAEALENICKRKSLENITVSQIAQEAGVTRQVFYHHFDDKFELASWIHYVHLYQSVKAALEENPGQMWHLTTRNWMHQLLANKEFYMNAFQSVSQKEFQRNIREFFFGAYKWQMKRRVNRELSEEEAYVLYTYLFGSMETVYEWISGGMVMTVERMVDLQELAMPEMLKKMVLSGDNVPYKDALKMMEQYLSEEGLLRGIS
jgi:AcrR family transcriptional regulator